MSWDELSGWLCLGGAGLAIWLALRASRRKAERIHNEAFAAGGKAALSASMAQNVTLINGSEVRRNDVRLARGNADADNGAADDGSDFDYVDSYYLDGDRSDVAGLDRRAAVDELGRGAPVVSLADRHSFARLSRRSVSSEPDVPS